MKRFIFAFLVFLIASPAFAVEKKETVYDRVIGTGAIRCGYFSWDPAIIKDPNTGEFRGIIYDYMNEVGKTLSLKVEFTEEIGLGDYPAALESGRIDAMCAGIWPTGERARVADFVEPVYYLPLYAYTQAGDTRFDNDIGVLDNPQYKIAVLEGGATSTIRRKMFPQSQVLELPQLTSPSELFVSLAQGKADVVIYDPFTFRSFDASNPGKLRQAGTKPVKIFPNTVAVMRGQEEFRRMLDNATRDLRLSGTIDKIIDRHEKYPGTLLRAAVPYRENP